MDDPNNPSIPASNSFPTPESAVPEMPMPGPMTTTTTTTQPLSIAEQPFGGTTSTTTTTPTPPDLPPVLPMAPEVEWPSSKPKSKLPQILGGIAAIILVVGVATAAYFVSNKISGRQAVAPNAPESKPLAARDENGKWIKPDTDEKGRPRQTEETGERVAASSACPQGCGSGEVCTDKGCRKAQAAPTGYGTGYTCTSSNCPGPCFSCNSTNTSCIGHPNVSGCEGVQATGTPAPTVATATTTPAPTAAPGTVVATLPPAKEYCVGSETCEAGDSCFQNFCRTYPSSHVVRTRSDGKGGSITFDYGGKIISYTGSTCPSGETVSNKTGKCESLIGLEICTYGQDCSDIEVPSGSTRCINNAIKTSFCCPPGVIIRNGSCTSGGGGTTTTTTTKKTGGGGGGEGGTTATSCNEQCPGSDGVLRSCTPPEADGSSNDSLCNSAGRVEVCGGSNYCCPSAGGAWTTDMAACSTTTTVTAGACYDVVLFAKIDGVYSTTPMTVAQKTSLHIGDMIRIAITGSKADLKARFRVFINDVVDGTGNTASPEWIVNDGAYSGADHKTTFYSDYEIKKSGNYKFEGQVTTEP